MNISYTRSYNVWRLMIERCTNPDSAGFKHYGGRGVKVCDHWADSPLNFLKDMGEAPEGFSLDRIDVDGHYCRENCRWATSLEQANNRRNTLRYEYRGQMRTIREISGMCAIPHRVLSMRLRRLRWPIERATTTPVYRGVSRAA